MKNKMSSTKQAEELYHLPSKEYGSETDLLVMDDPDRYSRELEQLYQEAEEYDFLLDRTPKVLPDHWQEEV